MAQDAVKTFLPNIVRKNLRVDLPNQAEEVRAVEHAGEVDSHAHAQGEGSCYKGHSQR